MQITSLLLAVLLQLAQQLLVILEYLDALLLQLQIIMDGFDQLCISYLGTVLLRCNSAILTLESMLT